MNAARTSELRHVLVPLDGSDTARAAIVPARRLLIGAPDPSLTLLEVVPAADPATLERERNAALARLRGEVEEERGRTRRLFRVLDERVRPPRVSHLVEHGDPAGQILAVANRFGVDAVAMTTHGRTGLARLVRGSVAETVLHGTEVPLLVSTPKATHMAGPGDPFLRVLVPLDGSSLAYQAVPLASTVARRSGAEVVLLRVGEEDPTSLGCLEQAAEHLLDDGVRHVVRDLTPGEPAPGILAAIERHRVGLVAMSTHGRTGLHRLRLGSVAEEVLRHSACPVLIVRGRD